MVKIMDDNKIDWLERLNTAAALANQQQNQQALDILNELPPFLERDRSLTPKFYVEFNLRRAELCGRIGDRRTSLQFFSAAMKTACDDIGEEELVCTVVRRLLDAIQEWEDWQLLLDTGKQLIGMLNQYGFRIAQMEAGYHMPFAYRGLGDFKTAREYAAAIIDALNRADVDPNEVMRWQQFLDSMPTN
jgi:tetratricopeptide (TPR) repeat protein